MTWLDHVFVIVLVGILPLQGLRNYRQLVRDLESGTANRFREYVESSAILWVVGSTAVALWLGQGRPPAAIGLAAPRGWAIVPALAVSGAAIWFLTAQLSRVRSMERRPTVGVEDIESVRAILPENTREMRAFKLAALSAGVFEEILFRGYLIAYLNDFLPLWLAVIVSAAAFAYAHIYQGLGSLPQIFVLALAAAGLYLWMESLLLPMILHAFVDINSVLTARAVLEKPPAETVSVATKVE